MLSVPYWLVCIFNFHNENLCTRKRKKESKPDTLTDERLYLILAKMPTECLYVQKGPRMIKYFASCTVPGLWYSFNQIFYSELSWFNSAQEGLWGWRGDWEAGSNWVLLRGDQVGFYHSFLSYILILFCFILLNFITECLILSSMWKPLN